MTFAVGHALTACSYDRAGLVRFWRGHHRSGAVGVEIAMSLLESELLMAWHARKRPHESVRDDTSRENRRYRVSIIRGLCAALRRVADGAHRHASYPITAGRR